VTLKESGTVAFPLDKSTPLISNSIQLLVDNQGKRYLSNLNFFNATVYIYDYDTHALVKKIPLPKDGLNGIGNPEFLAHYVKNMDTLIITNSWTSTVYLFNGYGKVLSKTNLPGPGPNKLLVGFDARTSKPLQVVNDNLYIIGHLLDFDIKDNTKLKNIITLDLKTKNSKRIFSRPDLFNKATWGGAQYELYGTYNNKSENLILGYAADPFLYQADLDGNVKGKYYLSSKYFKEVLPYSEEKVTNQNAKIAELLKHDHTTPRFSKVIFDPYANLYYRFVMLPMSEEDYKNPTKRDYQEESIIISDAAFNKVGEVLLPKKKYKTDMNFLTKEGLHLAFLPELQNNGDSLRFIKMKIEKK
jgi:hypothetical protein